MIGFVVGTKQEIEMERYLNHVGWSDVTPYEVVRVISEKTVEIREMTAERAEWKPEWIPGGFAGHCANQSEQKWTITSNLESPVIRCRLTKKGWKSKRGRHYPGNEPVKFYDYNF
jgi:hypothetical protein